MTDDATTQELPADEEPLEDDEWPTRGPSKGIRLAVPTAALIAVVLVAAGFWGGSTLQKNHGSGSSSGGGGGANAAAFLSRLRAASGATGATGATGASGAGGFSFPTSAATGTISVVDGNVLYVLTSSGSLVKVTLGASTTITRNAKSAAIGLRPGDSVVVQGTTAHNGNVAASSVAASAPGVSSGGFGGRGFGGAGTAATGTSGS